MKNTINKGLIHLLIIHQKNGLYLGLCKEFGFIEESQTESEVLKRLINSSSLLLRTVKENPRLEPSLNVGLPLFYKILYFKTILIGLLRNIHVNLQTKSTAQLLNMVHA